MFTSLILCSQNRQCMSNQLVLVKSCRFTLLLRYVSNDYIVCISKNISIEVQIIKLYDVKKTNYLNNVYFILLNYAHKNKHFS